ncbi:MAG: sigma-54 interaction domain-containing protein [Planctomycetota bacterium]|jgi:PAS domain S-box-containing protein
MERELDERFLPLIFDNISHAIFTIDESGTITSFNRKAEELTGFARHEAIGLPCHQIFRADLCEGTCLLKQSIVTGEPVDDWEVTITTKSGRKRPIAISTTALQDDDGKVVGGVEMFRDLSVEQELKRQLTRSYFVEDLVSKAPAMKQVFELLPLVARSDSTVLIEGDSGTGKEVIARAIHNLGPRSGGPFVAVNCGALPDTLLESELFGYVAGAFTDAKRDKPGRFALAEGGTLMLDEVGDLSLSMQAKLLRVLQTRQYDPLGATSSASADVRVIAAANNDLALQVRRKKFRQDLFFRLNVVRIQLPPLAQRLEDVPLLVQHFIDRFNVLQGRRLTRCTESAMAALLAYDYPGNVRELENAIEHAFVVCSRDVIQLEDLPAHIVDAASRRARPAGPGSRPLGLAEAEMIRKTLASQGGHRQRTATELGISRNTLWRKMKQYGIS